MLSSLYGFLVSYLCNKKKILDIISIFIILLRLVLWPKIWSILKNVSCAFKKNVYSASIGWNVLYVSVGSIALKYGSSPLFPYWFLSRWFIHCCKWSIEVPTIIALLSISAFRSVNNCLIYLAPLILCVCICYNLLMNCPLCHYIKTLFVSCYSFCLKVYFVWCKPSYLCSLLEYLFLCFHLLPVSVLKASVSLGRQHIVECYF